MRLNRMYRITSGLTVCVLAAVLAGCGGGRSGSSYKFNPQPYAVNAYAITSQGSPVTDQLHASSIGNLPLTFQVATQPAHGNVTINADSGTYTYTPDSGYSGLDSFTYTAASANGTSAAATATVVVDQDVALVSAFGTPVYVHGGQPTSVDVDVRLSNPPNGQATVDYTTVDGTAKAGTDYTTTSGTLTFGPGVTDQTVTIPLSGVSHQTYRYFKVRIGNPSNTLQIGNGAATVLLRYWPEPLNDTGVTGCATDSNGDPVNPDTCPQADYPNQDADRGRDRASYEGALAKVGYGDYSYNFGFDFTKIGFDGQPLFNQSANYNVDPWACVRDNWTGLEWEVATPAQSKTAGLYDSGYIYSWYDPDSSTNGGQPGKANGGPYKLDTYHYVQAVNQSNLCGHSDWRLPTASELRNLFNLAANAFNGRSAAGLVSLPNIQLGGYWTATSDPVYPSRAVVISSTYGYDSFLPKNGSTGYGGGYFLILVRGGTQ